MALTEAPSIISSNTRAAVSRSVERRSRPSSRKVGTCQRRSFRGCLSVQPTDESFDGNVEDIADAKQRGNGDGPVGGTSGHTGHNLRGGSRGDGGDFAIKEGDGVLAGGTEPGPVERNGRADQPAFGSEVEERDHRRALPGDRQQVTDGIVGGESGLPGWVHYGEQPAGIVVDVGEVRGVGVRHY